MRVCVSAKIKLSSSPILVKTVRAYHKGLQYCVDRAWRLKIRNNVKLHPFVYNHLRRTLPAQLSTACIVQACGIVKTAKTMPVLNRASVGYNFPRSAKFSGDVLSLRLLAGRESYNISIPECYREYFAAWEIREGSLFIDRAGRAFFRFSFAREVEARGTNPQVSVLGVDLGVKKLAVLSTGEHIRCASVRGVKRRYDYLRRRLQAKGTRSAHRLLQKVGGSEQRFVAWANHNLSKRIVNNFEGDTIKLECLKGVKKRRGRKTNRMLGRWSYYQLQNFIEYKAALRGIKVEYVNPAYTSQLCHKCGFLGERSKGSFACKHCGYTNFSADLNAARNIASPMLGVRQAAVTRPHDRTVETTLPLLDAVVDVMVKSPPL